MQFDIYFEIYPAPFIDFFIMSDAKSQRTFPVFTLTFVYHTFSTGMFSISSAWFRSFTIVDSHFGLSDCKSSLHYDITNTSGTTSLRFLPFKCILLTKNVI